MTNQISIPPRPSVLIESLRNIGYTIETALADIIDNSITATSSEIPVRFLWAEGNPWIAIADDGYGMTGEQLQSAMRFGSVSPKLLRERDDLGRFGLGMKTASISQCRRVTVCSKCKGELNACEWDLDRIFSDPSDSWSIGVMDEEAIASDALLMSLTEELLSSRGGGTIVLWRILDTALAGTEHVDSERKFSEMMANARTHLETVFHRFLSPEKGYKSVKLDFNKSKLEGFNPFGPAIPARQELQSETIAVDGEVIKIQPFVLPHRNKVTPDIYELYAGEGGYVQNQGFYVYRNRRLIVKGTWFRLIRKEELNKLIRVRIDIPNSLDHIWGININKSQVTPPEIVRKQLKKVIHRISGRGRMVFQRRATSLINHNRTGVWKREVREGKITYSINREHPLLSDMLSQVPQELRHRLEASFQMIADSFPYDIYYNDAANDDVDILPEYDAALVKDACKQLIDIIKSQGYEGEELRKRLHQTEIPGATGELIDQLLISKE